MLTQTAEPTSQRIPDVPWYAVHTRHQHEKAVAQVLSNKGFETFLPLYTSTNRWKDRTKILSLPLFPCYVFLKGEIDNRRLQILTSPGIHNIVSTAGQPTVIPVIEIESIQRVLDGGTRIEAYPFLKRGDRARIKSGPLAGIEGILVRRKNVWRLVLSVEMLGKSAALEVDAFQVERVSAKSSREYLQEKTDSRLIPQAADSRLCSMG